MRRALLACAAFVAVVSPASAATISYSAPIGGPPLTLNDGMPDGSLCPMNTSLVGIAGTLRNIGLNPTVAAASAICAGGTDSSMGEAGGVPGATTCSAGQHVVGITGRDGDFIDNLAVRCQPVTGGGTTTAAGFGGTGGSPVGALDCPAGTHAIGFTGEVVDWNPDHIRWLKLVCTS